MLQQYHTKLKGTLALTDSYLTEKALQKEKGLYKFIWVRQGSITVEIDHQEMVLSKDDVISLTHLQHLEFKSIDGEYMTLLFNSNFYCIYGNDHEVSCSGFLFNGSSHLVRFTLNEAERRQLDQITEAMENEFTVFRQPAGRNAAYPAEAFHHPMHPNRPSTTGYHARKRIRLRDCPPVLQSGRRALPDQKTGTGLCRYASQVTEDTFEHFLNM